MTVCLSIPHVAICINVTPTAYGVGYAVFDIIGGFSGCWPGYVYRPVTYRWPGGAGVHGWECR